jgi:PKD repeat protein
VAFSSAGSYDPDGTIASYLWNFRDGSTSSEPNPTHTFTTAGSYNVRLTVTDNSGGTGSAQVTITVTGGCTTNCLHSTAITLTARKMGGTVTVKGRVTVKNELGATIQGATVSITWTLPGGGTVSQQANTNAQGLASFQTSGTSGTYTLTVTNITKSGYTFDPGGSVLSKSITK